MNALCCLDACSCKDFAIVLSVTDRSCIASEMAVNTGVENCLVPITGMEHPLVVSVVAFAVVAVANVVVEGERNLRWAALMQEQEEQE